MASMTDTIPHMTKPLKLLVVIGTRPEAIKMAPIVTAGKQQGLDIKICVTGQHRELLDEVLDVFDFKPDYDLNVMLPGQTLNILTSRLHSAFDQVFQSEKPDITLVQGDTTSAYVGALVSFYHQVPVGHVEAGLRTHDHYSPFPEEMNRKLIGGIAKFHFAPTVHAQTNLLREGVLDENIYLTGNPVVDAIHMVRKLSKGSALPGFIGKKPYIVITAHRRENFGEPLMNICKAIQKLHKRFKQDYDFIFPVHPNPQVQNTVFTFLSNLEGIKLVKPLSYLDMAMTLENCSLILTDSGGIQEEAPSFKKPVLILRENSERMENVHAEQAILVGTHTEKIYQVAARLLANPELCESMMQGENPFGDGSAGKRIISIIQDKLNNKKDRSIELNIATAQFSKANK